MSNLDGELPTILPELITENTQSSESGKAESTTPHQSRRHLGDHECRIFAFVAHPEKPHFIYSTPDGWGRFYVNTAHIKHAAADCAKHVASQ